MHEIQAHDTPINKICMLKSALPKTLIATCANENKLKFWLLDRNTSILKHHSTLTTTAPVKYVCCMNRDESDYFISVEADANKILIKIYQILNDYKIRMLSKLGACVSGINSIIFRVESDESSLYITLVEDEVITFRIDDLFKGFKTFYAKQQVKNAMRKIKVKSNSDCKVWFTTACVVNECTFFGDNKGNVYSNKSIFNFNELMLSQVNNLMQICIFKIGDNGNELVSIKNCHKNRITQINESGKQLITTSEDGTLKIWTHNFEQQLGQYNSANGISALCKFDQLGKDTFIIGDKMGLLNLIRWHN